MHLDALYRVGSNENCDEPLCCRSGVGNASRWGSYSCDLTQPMVRRRTTTRFAHYCARDRSQFDAFLATAKAADVDAIVWTVRVS